MDIFIVVAVLAVMGWLGYLGYQKAIASQLQSPVSAVVHTHPTLAVQKGLAAAGGRGWQTSLAGSSVVATHSSTKATVRVDITEDQAGASRVTGAIAHVSKGSVAGITTYRSGQALLRKRTEIIGAVA